MMIMITMIIMPIIIIMMMSLIIINYEICLMIVLTYPYGLHLSTEIPKCKNCSKQMTSEDKDSTNTSNSQYCLVISCISHSALYCLGSIEQIGLDNGVLATVNILLLISNGQFPYGGGNQSALSQFHNHSLNSNWEIFQCQF